MGSIWMILGRVIHAPAPALAQAEQAAVQHAAQAEQAVVAAERQELEESVVRVDEVAARESLGEPPEFTISVAAPARVTFLTALHRAHPVPVPWSHDRYPYIIASGPFCLLAHFTTGPNAGYGVDFSRFIVISKKSQRDRHRLVVVRRFRSAGGKIAATAVQVPPRPRGVDILKNIESVGLVCDGYSRRRTYNYRIAELMVDTGRVPSLDLVIFRSDRNSWFSKPKLNSPLVDWDCYRYRSWVPHGAVAVDSIVMWFDLSWGILSCDINHDEEDEFQVFFYRLPRGRGLQKGSQVPVDIHHKRCITVSRDMLRYVEIIIPNGEAATVSMWSLHLGDERGSRLRWIANYSVSFQEIWNNDSYGATGLPPAIPVLAGVCPDNPNVVYFDLQHRLFGVNVPERRVVDYEANQHQLVNIPSRPETQIGSSRYLLTWNLVRPGKGAPFTGYVSPDQPGDDFPDDPDDGPQDPKGKSKGKSKVTDGRRKSSLVSNRPSKSPRIK